MVGPRDKAVQVRLQRPDRCGAANMTAGTYVRVQSIQSSKCVGGALAAVAAVAADWDPRRRLPEYVWTGALVEVAAAERGLRGMWPAGGGGRTGFYRSPRNTCLRCRTS